MLKLFLRECLLFRSSEKINYLFGILGWISLGLLVYAVGNLLTTGVNNLVVGDNAGWGNENSLH